MNLFAPFSAGSARKLLAFVILAPLGIAMVRRILWAHLEKEGVSFKKIARRETLVLAYAFDRERQRDRGARSR